jgi:8-oxo-dGTP pyrophosphatase MutT (NUDIX family)
MGDWQTLASTIIYADPWLRLRKDDVIRPNGSAGTYSVAELKGGVGIVPIDDDSRIYLVGQFRYAPDVYSWEIPKGAFESFAGEHNPLECAQRELEEEVGLTAATWTSLATVHTLMGSSNDKVYLYLADTLMHTIPHPDVSEDLTIRRASFDEILQLIRSEEMTDATSIAAVFLARQSCAFNSNDRK